MYSKKSILFSQKVLTESWKEYLRWWLLSSFLLWMFFFGGKIYFSILWSFNLWKLLLIAAVQGQPFPTLQLIILFKMIFKTAVNIQKKYSLLKLEWKLFNCMYFFKCCFVNIVWMGMIIIRTFIYLIMSNFPR